MNQGTSDVIQEADPAEILNVGERDIEEEWILDSGCSFHISSHKEWFEQLEPARGSVLLGNNQVCTIHGIGNIRMKLHDESIRVLGEVRFIPEVKRNLISLGMLERRGFGFMSEQGILKVYKES